MQESSFLTNLIGSQSITILTGLKVTLKEQALSGGISWVEGLTLNTWLASGNDGRCMSSIRCGNTSQTKKVFMMQKRANV